MCEFCKHHCWVGINYCPKCGRKANRMSDNLDKIITNVIEAEKNGVKIIIKQQYDREINDINIDFSEHDKKFNDKIASLKKQIEKLESIRTRCHESARDSFDSGMYGLLHIVTADELKTKDNIQKINLNETIKVKLTPLGAEIYYKQFDELNKQRGRKICKPHMPRIDKDGYTEFQLWHFIELYGQHIGMCKPNVIEPLDIVYCGNDKYHSDHAE